MTVILFSLMIIALILGTTLSFCAVFRIGCTPPKDVRILFGIAFVIACFVTYKVVKEVRQIVANLIKGSDIF